MELRDDLELDNMYALTSFILTQGDFLSMLQFKRGNSVEKSISTTNSVCPGAVTFEANIFNTK